VLALKDDVRDNRGLYVEVDCDALDDHGSESIRPSIEQFANEHRVFWSETLVGRHLV
jgi:hypothetical protein